jgi:signal transduction histidine kinase
VVFIGPCTAKKCEAIEPGLNSGVDAAITFFELRQLFRRKRISPMSPVPSEFDPPQGSLGALYGISRGFLQSAGLPEDLVTGDVIAADGRESFVQALKEFEAGAIEAKLLEVLACQGCIMGPGMDTEAPMFSRRSLVSDYVRQRRKTFDEAQWEKDVAQFEDLDLGRSFQAHDQRIQTPSPGRLAEILTRMGKFRLEDELNCGACGYDTCREHAIAIYKGLAEVTMCLPHTIEQLGETVRELNRSNDQLAVTQEALVQSEKLASMGQLAAGIAHELNNPLAVVLMYSHLLMDETNEETAKLRDDLNMIVRQAERCRKIVSGLLNFARQNRVSIQKTDLRELVEEAVRVSVIPDEIAIRVKHEGTDPYVDLDHDQVMQVVINLISNACAAMPEGGTLTLRTLDDTQDRKAFSISDTGTGISKDHMGRIFDPFFTTKDVGKGTGLGLAIAYGIVKMHRGDIRVESNTDPATGPTGTTFSVALPRRAENTD